MSLGAKWLAIWCSAAAMTAAFGATTLRPLASVASRSDVLRVCADPNNLPFSDEREQGFENAVAALVAADLGRRVEYVWQPQRRGFFRNTLRAGRCDVVMEVPAALEAVRATRPYFRSAYVFASRRDRTLQLRSLDDPRLHHLRIGIQITGQDSVNPPPAQALAARGIVRNVRGYMVYGDYSRPEPQRTVMDAVAMGDVDVAIVWGPLAGYEASRSRVPMDLTPVAPERDLGVLPFAFDISMGVRRDDATLARELDGVIVRRSRDIRRILERFHVPLVPAPQVVAAR